MTHTIQCLHPIPGHRLYSITEDGQIYRTDGLGRYPHKPITISFHPVRGKEYPNGYAYVTLLFKDITRDNGDVYDRPYPIPIGLHRLLAITFIPNPLNKPQVNHKDGNKLNNALSNLEWATRKENIQHSFDTGLRVMPKGADHWRTGKKCSISVKQAMSIAKLGSKHPKFKGIYIVNGKRFESANQAGVFLNIPPKTIASRANNPKFKDYSFIPKEQLSAYCPEQIP